MTIFIADYDPRWPAMFDEERARLVGAVGKWVLDIEHIGSTAVPGLGAKTVIDMLVGVAALADADAHSIEPICGLGYEYLAEFEAVFPERRYFRRLNNQGQHTHHIH